MFVPLHHEKVGKIELEVLKTIICAYHQAYEGYSRHVSAQWRTKGEGGWGFISSPPPRNSEGPPKSYQTQPDCENC